MFDPSRDVLNLQMPSSWLSSVRQCETVPLLRMTSMTGTCEGEDTIGSAKMNKSSSFPLPSGLGMATE
jgi:hypothetical protein